MFDTAIGDLVMRVCAQLLRLPIMVVTSLNSLPCVPFIPDNPLSSRPIYVAYHYYGAGHYDSTRSLGVRSKDESNEEQEPECQPAKETGCSCGSKEKSRNKAACINKGGKSRCPCVKRGRACDRDLCKCRSCGIVDEKSKGKKLTQCRCGEAKKSRDNVKQPVSCVDVTGRNRTKCPCFTAGLACKDCKCYNCKNSFGMNTIDTPTKGNGQEKKRKCTLSTPPSLKRRRGTDY